jgi:glycosyltransferase involved in cell wall biosynthesis
MADFTFLILTLNEEQHLPRLLQSIIALEAETFVLDSGSTDQTINICKDSNVPVKYHKFDNHPKQWDHALQMFEIKTPWVIGLDADQIVTSELFQQLKAFQDQNYQGIDGIYFNRKNFFKGKWIRYGGYYPVYLLKMFRHKVGYSDLNENMDHRFIVPGKTIVWKQGHLIEENLKENNISFWIMKHNTYSDLLGDEEKERIENKRIQVTKAKLWGSPDQRNAWFKRLWWKLPRYVRPVLYFAFRIIFQLGFLDGKTGILFHFLQGFWFRLIVDIKIGERLAQQKHSRKYSDD